MPYRVRSFTAPHGALPAQPASCHRTYASPIPHERAINSAPLNQSLSMGCGLWGGIR